MSKKKYTCIQQTMSIPKHGLLGGWCPQGLIVHKHILKMWTQGLNPINLDTLTYGFWIPLWYLQTLLNHHFKRILVCHTIYNYISWFMLLYFNISSLQHMLNYGPQGIRLHTLWGFRLYNSTLTRHGRWYTQQILNPRSKSMLVITPPMRLTTPS